MHSLPTAGVVRSSPGIEHGFVEGLDSTEYSHIKKHRRSMSRWVLASFHTSLFQ